MQFAEQTWQLAVHACMGALEYAALRRGDFAYWREPNW